jgi:hypothetical protein
MASGKTILSFGLGGVGPSDFVETAADVCALLNLTFLACVLVDDDTHVDEVVALSRGLDAPIHCLANSATDSASRGKGCASTIRSASRLSVSVHSPEHSASGAAFSEAGAGPGPMNASGVCG